LDAFIETTNTKPLVFSVDTVETVETVNTQKQGVFRRPGFQPD
jgi:hypothetical protein